MAARLLSPTGWAGSRPLSHSGEVGDVRNGHVDYLGHCRRCLGGAGSGARSSVIIAFDVDSLDVSGLRVSPCAVDFSVAKSHSRAG